MSSEKIKILYIAGNGRSGSTILHDILGQIDNFFAIGELRYVWERGLVKNRLCGCGSPIQKCEHWKAVLNEAYGGLAHIDAAKMSRLTESFRIQHLPLIWIPSLRQKKLSYLREYLDTLGKLYQAIQSITGCRVIVDSSKTPSYGYLLRLIPNVELYVLHFMRDSRAVAYSWTKKKLFQPGDYMARKTPFESAIQWSLRNLTTEIFLPRTANRCMTIRYEDFVNHPKESVAGILNLLGEEGANLPFLEDHTVELKVNHSVFGNPVRFQTGPVHLRLDEQWKKKMKGMHKTTVTAVTWPLLLRYQYLQSRMHLVEEQIS